MKMSLPCLTRLTRLTRLIMAGLFAGLPASAGAQQSYPSKPIRFITPYAPGGSTSIVARYIGEKFTESWGQPVIIDSRGGANTMIGTDIVAKAAPDGYTIIYTAMTHVVIPQFLPAPYDPIKDFAAVASFDNAEEILVVHPAVPANNLREFIALAKSRPGEINYASAGAGGVNHLAGEFFNIAAGVKLQHIPYKGAAPAMTDLMGGQVHASFAVPINAITLIKNGKLKGIAVSGKTRMQALPQLPTFAESGLSGYDPGFWRGVMAPAGTPRSIIDKLSTEMARMLTLPDIREKLQSQGLDPFTTTPEQFAELMKSDMAKYGRVIKLAGIKIEN